VISSPFPSFFSALVLFSNPLFCLIWMISHPGLVVD
jgi:hypothetical protein